MTARPVIRRWGAAALAAMSLSLLGAAPAQASLASGAAAPSLATTTGTRSLVDVLLSDGDTFDGNWYDYDIVTEAVRAVTSAKPNSPVGLLARGDVALTAFIPNDRAFQVLVYDLTRRWLSDEERVFGALVEAVGVDAVEQVLLYHVIPGATLDSRAAVAANGATLTTAQGGTMTVRVISRWIPLIQLVDKDPNDINPYVNPRALNINAGNRQIAHGIVLVLRPLDL